MSPTAIFVLLIFALTLVSKRVEKTILTAPIIFTLAVGIPRYIKALLIFIPFAFLIVDVFSWWVIKWYPNFAVVTIVGVSGGVILDNSQLDVLFAKHDQKPVGSAIDFHGMLIAPSMWPTA